MRLGFVTQPWALALPPSESIAIGTRAIAERLADEHEPVVWTRPPEGETAASAHVNGVEYRFVTGHGDYRMLRLTERLPPHLPDRRPLFTSYLHYPRYHLQVARAARRHGVDAIRVSNFSKLVPLFRRACPHALVVLSMHCEWLSQLDRRLVDRRLRGADVVVGVSDFVTDRIRDAFPHHADRCVTVHNGADVERFRPVTRRGDGPLRLLTVGRVSPEKGTHVLLEAFARLAERHADVELHVVGKEGLPPADMLLRLDRTPRVQALAPLFRAGYLERIRATLPGAVRPRVHFHPWVGHDELAEHYAQADAFVFPSVWDEPFGIPVAEAMAAALPVVATRAGGIPEIVVDGETGLLVPPADAAALAEALEAVVADERLRARLGTAGRRRALERFSWDRTAAAYRTIFAGQGTRHGSERDDRHGEGRLPDASVGTGASALGVGRDLD